MRALLVVAGLMLAGCASEAPPAEEPVAEPPPPAAPWPEAIIGEQQVPNQNFTVSGAFTAAVDVQNIALQPICSHPQEDCRRHWFETNVTLDLRAQLRWGQVVNDLDLYLFHNGAEISREGINQIGDAPNSEQILPAPDLPPGSYELVVVPWSAVSETYELVVTLG